MSEAHLGAALRRIRGLFEAGTVAGLTDRQLLDRYLARRDESAFAALVMRHGPMVLSVCRAVLRGSAEVEDAFQATFLVLVRKASTIRGRDAVGGWLYRVARRVAVEAGRERSRQARRETATGGPRLEVAAEETAPDDDWQRALHEELGRLPGRLREPIVLCYLEGRTHAQAALELRWSEATLRRRLADARELLRLRLTRRGVAGSAAALAAAMESRSLAAVAPAWAEAAIGAATDATAAAGIGVGAVSTSAIRLARRTVRGLIAGRVRAAVNVLTLLVAGGLLGGHLVPAGPARGDDPRRPRMQAASARPAAAAKESPKAGGKADRLTVRGRVLDPDGKPIAGAPVYSYVPESRSFDVFFAAAPAPDVIAGTDGRFELTITDPGFAPLEAPGHREDPVVAALVRGFGPGWATVAWAEEAKDVTLRLSRDDVSIDGRIIDLEGRPVPGVTVRPVLLSAPTVADLSAWEAAVAGTKDIYDRPGLHHTLGRDLELYRWGGQLAVKTGPDGRFHMTGLGRERVVALWLEGPTIASELGDLWARTRSGPTYTVAVDRNNPDFGKLVYHGATFEHAAAPTRPIEGVVRDKSTGRPIAGISIRSQRFAGNPISGREHVRTTTGGDGRYRLLGMPIGSGNVIIAKPGPGQPYRTGVASLDDDPRREAIRQDFELEGSSVMIRGKVTDKSTGLPVPAVVEYFVLADNPHRGRPMSLVSGEVRTGPDGSFELAGLPGRGIIAARALRDHYLIGQGAETIKGAMPDGTFRTDPHICEPERFHALAAIEPGEDARSFACDLALDPGAERSGTVLDSDGRPLSGCVATNLFPHTMSFNMVTLRSDAFTAGALDPAHPRPLIFRHEGRKLAGMMIIRGDEAGPIAVRLRPAGILTGRLVDDQGEPRHDVRINVRHADGQFSASYSYPFLEAPLGHDGRFRVEGLTPGVSYDLDAIAGFQLLGSIARSVKLEPGEARILGNVTIRRAD